LSHTELRTALFQYCQSSGYLAAMIEGAVRIDLAGEPAGLVTAEATAAAAKTARLSQKMRREQRETKMEKAVAAVVPEQQAAPKNDLKNGNAIKLSLAGLRAAAARRRQAAGV
jgi:ProP effector